MRRSYSKEDFKEAEGLAQGTLSLCQGGSFKSGFASGALGSFGASAWGAMVGDKLAKSAVGTIAFGALRGGVGAEFTDGNFWQGVVIGGMVAGLNHTMHRAMDDGEGPKPKTKKLANRKSVVEPSFAKMVEVEGNALGMTDLVRGSKLGQFVRGGRPALEGISKGMKIGGNTLGIVGVALEYNQVQNGEMTWTEFGVDTLVSGAVIGTSIFAAPAVATGFAIGGLVYVGGKAIYEYSTGQTLFTKPK